MNTQRRKIMQPNLYTVARESPNVLAGASLNVNLDPPAVSPLTGVADFFALLRSNHHAAALHAAMRHERPSFRECSRPACLDAGRMIPQLEGMEPGATDAELGTFLEQVLAELETSFRQAAMVQ